MLKVLQISNKAPYPTTDGSAIAIYNMANGFIDNDVDLHFITINTKKHFKPDENVPSHFKIKSHYQSVYKDTDVKALGAILNLFSNQSYFVSRFNFKEFEEVLVKTLQQNKFDWVQLESIFMAEYIPVIKKYSRAKISIRTHNIEHQIWERTLKQSSNFVKNVYLGLQTKRLKSFEMKVLEQCDAIITISNEDANYFKKCFPNALIFNCPTGLNLNDYQLSPNVKNSKSVFHFGSMDWMPNIEAVDWLLDKVWQIVLKAIPDAVFNMAGRNLPAHLQNTKVNGVNIVGEVNDNAKFYNEQNVMIVPLLSGSGIRIKMLEGMAYSKSIVSTSIGAEGINVANGEHCLIADTPEDFANKLVTLLKDDGSLRTQLANNARVFMERNFDNKTLVAGIVDFYKKHL